MKRTNYITILALALGCAGFGSCNQEEIALHTEQDYEQEFTGQTRVGTDGAPAHGDTYRIMASPVATIVNTPLVPNDYHSGSYAYSTDGGYSGSLGNIIPVAVDATTYKTTFTSELTRDGRFGMHLAAGEYYVSMIYPGVPSRFVSSLGTLAVFNRKDKIYASQPFDRNGDGTPNDSLKISVGSNRQVHNIGDDVVMHPLMSAIEVYLYSSFPSEDDIPNSINFTVDEIMLVNAGSNGWYNPIKDIVYPNYNYQNNFKTNYSNSLDIENTNPPAKPANEDELKAVTDNTSFKNADGNFVTAKFKVESVPVFPSDYRGEDMGGLFNVMPMTLRLKLIETPSGLFNKASVPLSIEIKRNKLYRFYVNVTSEQIEIQYSVKGWDFSTNSYTIDDDLGGILQSVPISWINSGNWNPEGNDQEIK